MFINDVCWLVILISLATLQPCITSFLPFHHILQTLLCSVDEIMHWHFQRNWLILGWNREKSQRLVMFYSCVRSEVLGDSCVDLHILFLCFTTSGIFQRVWLERWDEFDCEQSGDIENTKQCKHDQKTPIACTRCIGELPQTSLWVHGDKLLS